MIRVAVFAGILLALAAWEMAAPRRPRTYGRAIRWPSNFGIVVIDTVLVRLLFPVTAVGLAMWLEAEGYGLLNVLALPGWVSVPVAVILLDLAIYAQHVMFHYVPVLW